MENKPEGTVYYTVARSSSGQWEVHERGFDKSIASFSRKEDAIEYAERLAETKRSSEIKVCE